MADVLLVHDLGHSSRFWGPVWGHLTAPQSHPPRLYQQPSVGKVHAMDLPEHDDGPPPDGGRPSYRAYVSAITEEVERLNLRDLVLVGHGFSAPMLLRAAGELLHPPKQIVLFAGVVPFGGKSAPNLVDPKLKLMLMLLGMRTLGTGRVKLPGLAVTRFYCNEMDPFQLVPVLGRFKELPLNIFRAKMRAPDLSKTCPVAYVPLSRNNVVSGKTQGLIASSIAGATLAPSIDACHEVMIEKPLQVAETILGYC